ncbi:MAG: tetratricopeptide repeat protein [Acidobacteriia bacterium]|nr:tetratricopeptide repeat protein [Terriglobia bacterium]
MNLRKGKLAAIILLILGLLLTTGACNRLRARDRLNKGVRAYRDQRYQAAVDYFKEAVNLDPGLMNARLYLATAYATQYVPGVESDENKQVGEQAIKAFQDVLAAEPNNSSSIAGIASIYFNMANFEEAKKWYRKRTEVEPNNPEPYYSIGVVDWTLAYKANQELRINKLNNLAAKEPLPAKDRDGFAQQYQPIIDDGLEALQKAVQLNPDYDDAMAYLNLLYRQKADCETDADVRQNDLNEADKWFQKAKDIKFKKEQQTTPGQVTPQ